MNIGFSGTQFFRINGEISKGSRETSQMEENLEMIAFLGCHSKDEKIIDGNNHNIKIGKKYNDSVILKYILERIDKNINDIIYDMEQENK